MSEKDKMLNQEYYISCDNELTEERERAKDLLFEFNHMKPSQRYERNQIIQKLFHSVGENAWIESPFNCDYGYNITVGDNFYTNTNCTILDCAKVTIGNNVWIGPNVSLYTPNHAIDAIERIAGYERTLPINISDNVWIGGSVTIVPGVTIGDNSIIGAGSVVTKDIPANVIAAGVPCKVIRSITEKDKIGLTTNKQSNKNPQ
ncbi:sugar O-acetyltransferase [Peribacillus muralis]|uniref:sugar O-acetyltransferase n=1 Tax=Peribacillus muralis TaxID=264697 RepID=UPI001F4EE60B|nr:sugar O-acetyltransferase [Peribacillus muralis]MCK1995152.1 sugar O-acetyltransferase [Peribacillus muralis]MCK2015765.1 sugar O-acetyltransferase [Peribacillus muralis]